MIRALIFSKDRPMQLDALLTSIERYASHVLDEVHVLWTVSDTRYLPSYLRCDEAHDARGYFHLTAAEFEAVTKDLLSGWDRVCFLVDDDLFFRRAIPPTGHFPFSYRLGRQAELVTIELPMPIHWRSHPNTDEGYPLSLDGHIYETATLPPLDFPFANPTQLEAGLAGQAHLFEPEIIYGYRCLVGIPANRVSESSNMPTFNGPSAEELNARYLAGERIDLDATFAGITVNHAHQEIHYRYHRP